MAEWLVEEGIAEHRAVQMDGDRIVAAQIEWPGSLRAGWVIEAKLISRASGSARGGALAPNGEQVLVDRLPRTVSTGQSLRLLITRAAFASRGRFKHAQGRPIDAAVFVPTLAERLVAEGAIVRTVRRFPGAHWDELIDEALAGTVAFASGALLFAPTPAMTTVDVDGELTPRALALAAAPALAGSLQRFDIGGSVAVDFPTLGDKADRRAVDQALDDALVDWPHERTAMNGFGLVQIVSKLERPSLLHLAAWQRAGLVWRRLLRRSQALEGAGHIELILHPALERRVIPSHLAVLERQTGRRVAIRTSEDLALEAPHAQLVADG